MNQIFPNQRAGVALPDMKKPQKITEACKKAESKAVAKTEKSAKFGYYPQPLDFTAEGITVSTLPNLSDAVDFVEKCHGDCICDAWFYPPRHPKRMIRLTPTEQSCQVAEMPFSARVFGLPKTHQLTHKKCEGDEHLDFLVWCLGFFLGMRLSAAHSPRYPGLVAGFVDATPIQLHSGMAGRLVDFFLPEKDRGKAILQADKFWCDNSPKDPRITKAVTGAIHCLFLSQKGAYGMLPYERFIYLYTAVEGCHFVHESVRSRDPKKAKHFERIPNLCREFGIEPPDWTLDSTRKKNKESKEDSVTDIRNKTIHDGLFFEQPLGFGPSTREEQNKIMKIMLPMQNLVCRFLFGILTSQGAVAYVRSDCNDRSRHCARLP